MLVAYGPDGRPVIAEETPLEQLQSWSQERVLHCPNCRGVVHVRGGPTKRTQLHFAHQKGECAWSTESESVRHARGKMVLAHWLRKQFPQAAITLEERLAEPNRIADIFVSHANGERWAVEFQCAPLNVDEWHHRHNAYRKAHVLDIWIIGTNRREKQEAFIEAIIATAHEILFLDPLVTPPPIWLRWPVSYEMVQAWQPGDRVCCRRALFAGKGDPVWGTGNERGAQGTGNTGVPSLEGWVGRVGYGATLRSQLHEVYLGEKGVLLHPARTRLETRTRLLQHMSTASCVDEAVLTAYVTSSIDEEAVRVVILPLMRAYLRDPDLLRRYNYGRGLPNQPCSEEDRLRVQKGQNWLIGLAAKGFSSANLQELAQEIPFVGPYAAFIRYIEMLIHAL